VHSPTFFYEGREGILWIGTVTAGLWRVRRHVAVTLSEEQGLRDHNVYPIYQDRAGAIWIGVWPNSLTRYYGGKFDHFTERDGLLPYIGAIYQGRAGALWVGA
jgi:Two component regulator propeller